MKTLMMSLMAAVLVFAAASMASADKSWSEVNGMTAPEYHGLTAIDSAGLTAIDIKAPSGPVGFVKVYDKISLDSNNELVVNDIVAHPSGYETIAEKVDMEKGMAEEKGVLFCFGSLKKTCAEAY